MLHLTDEENEAQRAAGTVPGHTAARAEQPAECCLLLTEGFLGKKWGGSLDENGGVRKGTPGRGTAGGKKNQGECKEQQDIEGGRHRLW